MPDHPHGQFGAVPPDPAFMHCCVCAGPLLYRNRPFKPEWRMWFAGAAGIIAESSYAHTDGCMVSAVPAGRLLGLNKDQALAEARRMREEDGDNSSSPSDP
ncbi:hypothetical protein ABT116_19155 [Streptomyces sp. NPDC002130]|uniref:hypothetical protein n=1 Tax=Streptomyces sp. NPDC002130 TaxID=3155568 RepID=UPI0033167598